MDKLIAITQATPVRCQEVQDHNQLAVAFGLWCWLTGLLSPHDLATVVLVECGLIMCDENKSEWGTIRHWKSIWAWEFASIIIPVLEVLVINLPLLNKSR